MTCSGSCLFAHTITYETAFPNVYMHSSSVNIGWDPLTSLCVCSLQTSLVLVWLQTYIQETNKLKKKKLHETQTLNLTLAGVLIGGRCQPKREKKNQLIIFILQHSGLRLRQQGFWQLTRAASAFRAVFPVCCLQHVFFFSTLFC